MALNHSPSIVTNGLVFAYDMNNTQKSWKGAPTTNLISISNWNNNLTGWSSWFWVTGTRTMDSVNVLYQGVSVLEGLITGTAQGGPAYLDLGGLSTTLGTTYTVSVWFKSSSRSCYVYSHDTLGNGTVYGNTTVANGAWQKSTFIFTVVSTTGSMRIHLIANSGNINDTIYVTAPQVELGSLSTPFVNGTRSNTQAIVDLTSTNTATATSLTYNSNNTFSFNGTSNSISMGNVLPINTAGQQITIDVWIFATRASGYIIGRGQNNANYGHYSLALNGLTPQFGIYSSVAAIPAQYFLSGINIILNTWNHICISHIAGNSASTKFTINDVSTGSWTTGDGTAVSDQTSTALEVGHWFGTPTATSNAYWFQGDISLVKLYNRVLSTTEIKQNFNALRGRYGL